VSNIIDLAVTEESFERPKGFDLTRFWVTSSRAFEISVYHSNATLRVTPRGLAKLGVLGSLVAQAAAETATPPDADGWVSVTIPIESVERAASGLIALGADAEVVEPSELRERLVTTVQELVRLYFE
jgi:predicted DNA-binding transcriptional regulator YafY